jgi:DNA-directed RNA polymerase specialized sigma24 family protein
MEYVDFFKLDEDEKKIDKRLRNWAMWVRPKRGFGAMHPMFRWYRPTEHWQNLSDKTNCDIKDAEAVEKVMRQLTQLERVSIKWYYIELSSPTKICKILKVDLTTLRSIVKKARKSLQSFLVME